MRAIVPSPLISLALFLAWLMLNESLALGQLLLGAALAIALPHVTERLRPDRPRFARWGTIVRLGLVVLGDIVRSNLQVARLILGPEHRIQPRFVWLPLSIRDPHGIVALAGIITMTPGTLTADVSADGRALLVHSLHAPDPDAIRDEIKTRYESRLKRIFE